MSEDYQEDCLEVIASLKKSGINFLAIDFDQTLVTEHTGGVWQKSVQELVQKIRPFFRKLVPMAVNNDLFVAIVTFSPQSQLIADVLINAWGDTASGIPIRGRDGTWEYHGEGSRDGKQPHMASAAEEIQNRTGIKITRNSTLLIDDDMRNINYALNNSVRAIHIKLDDINTAIKQLKNMSGRT